MKKKVLFLFLFSILFILPITTHAESYFPDNSFINIDLDTKINVLPENFLAIKNQQIDQEPLSYLLVDQYSIFNYMKNNIYIGNVSAEPISTIYEIDTTYDGLYVGRFSFEFYSYNDGDIARNEIKIRYRKQYDFDGEQLTKGSTDVMHFSVEFRFNEPGGWTYSGNNFEFQNMLFYSPWTDIYVPDFSIGNARVKSGSNATYFYNVMKDNVFMGKYGLQENGDNKYYQQGLQDGIEIGEERSGFINSLIDIFTSLFTGIFSFLTIPLIKLGSLEISIFSIVAIPLIFSLLYFILKFIRG